MARVYDALPSANIKTKARRTLYIIDSQVPFMVNFRVYGIHVHFDQEGRLRAYCQVNG